MHLLNLATSICNQNEWSTSFRRGEMAGDGWIHSFTFGDLVRVKVGRAGFKYSYNEGVVVQERTRCYVDIVCGDGIIQKKLKKNLEQVHLRGETQVEKTTVQLKSHICENVVKKGVRSEKIVNLKPCEPPSVEIFKKCPTDMQQKPEQNATLKPAEKPVSFKPSAASVICGFEEMQKSIDPIKGYNEDRNQTIELGANVVQTVNAKPYEPTSREVIESFEKDSSEVPQKIEQDATLKSAEKLVTNVVCQFEKIQKSSDTFKGSNGNEYTAELQPIQTSMLIKSHSHSKTEAMASSNIPLKSYFSCSSTQNLQ